VFERWAACYASSMRLRSLGLTCAAFFTAATVACTTAPCNDIGCDGGFQWTGRPAGGATLSVGTYVLAIELEDDSYTIECTIEATVEASKCGEPTRVSGEVEWSLDLSLSQTDPDVWDPKSPVAGFYFRASDVSGSDDAGSYSETRGPTRVAIAIRREGEPVTEIDYAIEYVRDDEYRGHEDCGFCDEIQDRTHNW